MTKQQAIRFAKSKKWVSFTDEQIVRLQLFQKKVCVDWSRFRDALENVLKRPVYTHELGVNVEGLKKEFLGDKEPPTFKEILTMLQKGMNN